MEISAIRHIANKHYCYSLGDYRFLFKIEAKRNDIEEINLHIRDKYVPIDIIDTRRSYSMKKVCFDSGRDYYEIVVDIWPETRCSRYYFEIKDKHDKVIYLGNEEFFETEIDDIDRMFNLTVQFREEERAIVPEWAKNSVVYQIFVSRYATTEYVSERDWYKTPMGHNNNLYGNLRGIINTFDHIMDLGVDAIYLTPIFKSPSEHKYDTVDYYTIDPSFGTKEDLKELVELCHKNGKKIILDGVFNHTSTKFFAFEDVTKKGSASEYKDWYYIKDFPVRMGQGKNPPNYLSFSYYGGMPKTNLTNKATSDYFIGVGCYWIREFDIDGWRLDVADEMSHVFMKNFRNAVKSIKEDVLIVGEDWQYGNDYLEGDEWDSLMNYSFLRLVDDFIKDEKISADEALGKIGHMRGFFNREIYSVLWNLIDTHDTARFLAKCDYNRDKQRLAASMQLLLPGMPMIFYGDEYGMGGDNANDCRRGMVWDNRYRDLETYTLYKNLIALRKRYKAFVEGEIININVNNGKGIISITYRFTRKMVVVIFHAKAGTVDFPEYKGNEELITGTIFDGSITGYKAVVIKTNN